MSEERQLLLVAICQNAEQLPPALGELVAQLCLEVGGQHYDALYAAVTTRRRLADIAMECYVDESVLYRYTEKYFRRLEREIYSTKWSVKKR